MEANMNWGEFKEFVDKQVQDNEELYAIDVLFTWTRPEEALEIRITRDEDDNEVYIRD